MHIYAALAWLALTYIRVMQNAYTTHQEETG